MDNLSTQPGAPDWYHPGRSGLIKLGDRVMAQFGELHPEIVAGADFKGPVAAFEVFLDAPPLPKAKATKARPKLVLVGFPAAGARLRLHRRCRGRGREAGARRAQRRQGAGDGRARVRRLCRQGRARRQEVGGAHASPCSRSSARSPMPRSRRRVPRSWRRWPRQPVLHCVVRNHGSAGLWPAHDAGRRPALPESMR